MAEGRRRWVLDTNVVVSGLLSATGCPGRLLDMVLARELRLTFDDRIEAEYRQVLARPRLAIPIIRAAAFLSILQFQDHVSALPWHGVSTPDLEDLKFLEAAQQASEKILVTGNLRHYPPACRGAVRVLTPRQAWEYLVGQDR